MKPTLFLILLLIVSCAKSEQEQPYFAVCPCETVQGFEIQVCEGQDWEKASYNALAQQAKDSNCE